MPFISVIVVTLNSGDALLKTVNSILDQNFEDYEILIKDGGSKDGSIEKVRSLGASKVRIEAGKDAGIYDAMNQAVKMAKGKFVIFLNAGDTFWDKDVLKKISEASLPEEKTIAYGDTYFEISKSMSKAPAHITGSVCYRNIPCHQAIIYSKDTLTERGFDTSYRIRADFEHFMWAYFEGHIKFVYLDMPVCSYEGGGFSENKKNADLDKKEYKRAVRTHIPASKRFVYRATLILTLHKLRGALAKNPKTATFYQKIKEKFR